MRFTIFAKAFAFFGTSLMLSGCLAGSDGKGFGASPEDTVPVQTMRKMAQGDIIASAPTSYCFDPSVTSSDRFALLADCGALTDSPDADPSNRGLLSLSISTAAPEAAIPVTLEGEVAGATQSAAVDGLRLKQISANDAPFAGADSTYWRGVLPVNNRILVFSAYAPEGGSLSGNAGQTLIERFAAKTKEATGAGKTPLFARNRTTAAKENAEETQIGIIGRLFQRNQSDTQ